MSDIHTTPVDDLMPHVQSRDCWCCPTVRMLTENGASDVEVIHNALDMRECKK